MSWEAAVHFGETETAEEFDSYEEAVKAFREGNYDIGFYGIE